MIVGRRNELAALRGTLEDDRSHFVAVYGRRRIGKTFLIREAFGRRFTFQHAGIYGARLSEQLEAFAGSIRDAGGQATEKRRTWLGAFEDLKALIRDSTERKKVIFLDELSWMATPNSDMLRALENFWNGWASARDDVVLVVCASATSWMLSHVVHAKGGLYNRLTGQIRLAPFTLAECEEYVNSRGLAWNRSQILQCYMVFGGVPYYWSLLERGQSLAQNIDRLLFAPGALLADEFRYLYASIFAHPEPYERIIGALARKKAGMTREEIIEATKLANSGALTSRLEELESCGFIRRYAAFGTKKKGAVWQLMDCFTLFHHQFLADRPTDAHYWSSQLNTPRLNTWNGLAFERVCLWHVPQIKRKLGISGVYTDINAWSARPDPDKGIRGAQIDLLIVRRDQVINLCEMKYAAAEYAVTKNVDENIRNKIHDLTLATGGRYAIHPTLVTTYGLVENTYSADIQSLITMDDLFAPSD